MRPDGRVGVVNTCKSANGTGKERVARGSAGIIPGSNGARLAVRFVPLPIPEGQGNYYVLYLDPNYQTALIGSPSGRYLWMLARTKSITPEQRGALNAAAARNGYRLDLVKETIQP